MSFNIGSGYKTYNYTQYGNTGTGNDGKNYYLQMNDGANQTLTIGSNYLGANQKNILATDNGDSIVLNNSWKSLGYQTSDTGAAGNVFQDANGGEIMVSGGAKVSGYSGGPSVSGETPTKDQVIGDIDAIENDPANSAGAKDKLIDKGEIQRSLDDGKIDASRKGFWQDILNRFSDFDNGQGGNGAAKTDGLINIDDITANGTVK